MSRQSSDWDNMFSDDDTDWRYRQYDEFDHREGEVDDDRELVLLRDPVKRAEWFDSLKTELNEDDAKFMDMIEMVVGLRFEKGQSALSIKDMGKFMLLILRSTVFTNKEVVAKRIDGFYSSNVLQKEFVYRMGLDVKPEKLNVKGYYVGYKVDLKKLSGIMLKNKSLLKSVVAEQKLIDDIHFTEYNSEVTCNSERRRNRLLGKLRFIIGIEEYDLFKHNDANRKYYMFYVCFMNIPLEERFKRQDAHLFCVVSESKLRQTDLTVQEVVKSIADELKVMEVDGVDVELLNDGDNLPDVINIKGALAAVCPTKMAMHEIVGHRQPRLKKTCHCHFCGATESEIQHIRKCLPLVGAAQADFKEYDQCIRSISQYEQKMRKNAKSTDDDEDYSEEEKSSKKLAQLAKAYKNRFDVYRSCPFTALPGINLWNISPPNVVADLADGVVSRLMTEFIFVHGIKDLSDEEIVNKINEFKFAVGKIEVRFGNGSFTFSRAVKSFQKLELLFRLEEIFPDNLNLGHKGHKLLETLQSFTKLALSFSIPLDDISKLKLHAQTLVQLCLDLSPTFQVFPKLHELLHYSDLTQLYGPLIYYTPMKNHKKELLFYNYSRALTQCTSVTKTHLCRRQMLSAMQLNKQKYISVDLFANSNAQLANGYELLLKLEVDRLNKIEEDKKKRQEEKEQNPYEDDDDESEEDEYDALDDSIG